jgi:hypothetical protein
VPARYRNRNRRSLSLGAHAAACALALCLLLPGTMARAAGAAAAPIPDFTAHYSAYRAGFRVIRSRVSLRRQGDRYVYTSFSEPVGLISLFVHETITEHSIWTYHDGGVRPLSYRYQLKGSKHKDVHLVFDWSRHQVSNTVAGDTWTLKIPDGTLDKFSVELAVALDLARSATKLTYPIADDGELKHYRFAILGREQIKTPAGSFEAVKLIRQRDNDKRKTYIWCAPALHYVLVRMEHIEPDGSHYYLSLDKIEGPMQGTAADEAG